jgi:hypothetical protein
MRGFSLSRAAQASVARALSTLGGSGPLPVVAVTDQYATLLDNWIRHIEALGIHRFLVVAMDRPLMDSLTKAGIVAAYCEFDGSVKDFWLQRMLIWDLLVQRGVDLIQSDIDAVWLKDPIPEYFSRTDFDLLISQGTFHPVETHAHWQFVLCTGLFWARPGPGAKAFFSAWRSRGGEILASDDQAVMNRLLHENGTVWCDTDLETYRLSCDGHTFTCYNHILPGTCDSLGFRIGMLPHYLFPRLTSSERGAFVKHVRRPKDPCERISALREAECWLLGDDFADNIDERSI